MATPKHVGHHVAEHVEEPAQGPPVPAVDVRVFLMVVSQGIFHLGISHFRLLDYFYFFVTGLFVLVTGRGHCHYKK